MRPIRLSPFTTSEWRPPDRGGGGRVRPGEAGLVERPPRHPTVNTRKYPAAALFLVLAAAVLVPFVVAPLGSTVLKMTGVLNPAANRASAETRPLVGAVGANSAPQVVRNATNLIADGTFDAIPGPWIYTNGTTGAVTASRDPQARARLGHTTPVLRFDSMDDVFGANPWTSSVSNGQVSSNLSQETAIRTEGNGSMRDDIAVVSNNQRAGAIRDDPLPWNWSGYDRLAIWMNKATPGTLWAWVYVQDENGQNTWGLFSLVGGWYRYPMDLGPPLDLTRVSSVEIAFASTGAATGTVYIDDIVLFNSTTFAESAHVAQTFTKAIPTGGSPNSLRLVFDLQATASVLVGRTAVFTGGGWGTDGNPVPLPGTAWSSTIGQIVSAKDTSATLQAPAQRGTGLVTATHGTITGTANVTVDLPAIVIPPSSPRDLIIWPAFALVVGAFGAAGFLALRRSAKHAFRMEDLFLINGEGLLIAHTTSRRDSHGDEDILAGMLTAIMSFAQDVFQEEIGGLRQFEIGNKTVAEEPELGAEIRLVIVPKEPLRPL